MSIYKMNYKAEKHIREGEYDKAIKVLSEALKDNGPAPSLLINRAVAFINANSYERAVDDLTFALEQDPTQQEERKVEDLVDYMSRGVIGLNLATTSSGRRIGYSQDGDLSSQSVGSGGESLNRLSRLSSALSGGGGRQSGGQGGFGVVSVASSFFGRSPCGTRGGGGRIRSLLYEMSGSNSQGSYGGQEQGGRSSRYGQQEVVYRSGYGQQSGLGSRFSSLLGQSSGDRCGNRRRGNRQCRLSGLLNQFSGGQQQGGGYLDRPSPVLSNANEGTSPLGEHGGQFQGTITTDNKDSYPFRGHRFEEKKGFHSESEGQDVLVGKEADGNWS